MNIAAGEWRADPAVRLQSGHGLGLTNWSALQLCPPYCNPCLVLAGNVGGTAMAQQTGKQGKQGVHKQGLFFQHAARHTLPLCCRCCRFA